MPRVNVNIRPEIINWALSQTQEEKLGDKLMNNVAKWLDGSKTPTFNQIEDFSKKANIPLGYFFLQTPPVEQTNLLEYRTFDSVQLANPSQYFRCGEITIARKAFDCNKIEQNIYHHVVQTAIENYKQMKENKQTDGGNYYNTMSSRLDGCLIRALCESINMGRTTYTEAYRFLYYNDETVRD